MCKPTFALVSLIAVALICTNCCEALADSTDFNFDGGVDAADLERWRSAFEAGQEVNTMPADADFDGDTDGNDFLAWQREVSEVKIVAPEPATICLAVPFVLFMISRRNRSTITRRIDQAHARLKPSMRIRQRLAEVKHCKSLHSNQSDDQYDARAQR